MYRVLTRLRLIQAESVVVAVVEETSFWAQGWATAGWGENLQSGVVVGILVGRVGVVGVVGGAAGWLGYIELGRKRLRV